MDRISAIFDQHTKFMDLDEAGTDRDAIDQEDAGRFRRGRRLCRRVLVPAPYITYLNRLDRARELDSTAGMLCRRLIMRKP